MYECNSSKVTNVNNEVDLNKITTPLSDSIHYSIIITLSLDLYRIFSCIFAVKFTGTKVANVYQCRPMSNKTMLPYYYQKVQVKQ